MKTLTSCPVCGANNYSPRLTCTDNTVSKKEFQVVACDACGFHFTNPQPSEEELGAYYESEDYVSHSDSSKGVVNWMYQKVRSFTLKKKLALVNRLSAKGNLLDVGCGTGYFLATCKNDGWKTTGIEPSAQARKVAHDQHGLDVFDEPQLNQLPEHSFDVISLWHVLEHVPHLQQRVEELRRLLKPGGVLIIAVPNRTSYDAEFYGRNWAAWDVPRHLWHFSPDDIKRLFGQHEMDVKEILPMRFDAYYVSMLSEKYKNGKPALFAAFRRGWTSNGKSAGNPPRCSSQIYIIRNR